jgi:hypothetical protein
MTLEFNDNGLSIETLAEIQAGIEAAYRQVFGNAINLQDRSVAQNEIGVYSAREAKVQNEMLDLFKGWRPFTSTGVSVDILFELRGQERLPATNSVIESGVITGTPTTVIPNGKRIQLDATGEEVEIVDGPYTIPGGGTLSDVHAQAVNTGPLEFPATVATGWTITTPVVGWDTFANTADAEIGRNTETDPEMKARGIRELASGGRATLPAITANVSQVDGVTFARTYENTTLVTDGDGIPGKAINVVCEGGTDAAVAEEIFLSKPAGIQSYGTDVTETVVDDEGNSHTISFDRTGSINIYIKIVLTTSTSEETFPSTGEDQVETAVLDYGNNFMNGVGQDVLSYKLIGAIEDAEIPGIDAIALDVDTSSPASGSKVAIGIRDRADYDSLRVAISQV